MPVVDAATFTARYPEFTGFATATLDLALSDAEADTDAGLFGALHPRVISALAAHRLSLNYDETGAPAQGSAALGPLQMATVDNVSSTYAVPQNISPLFAHYYSTRYGVEYLSLVARFAAGPHLAAG